MSKHYQSSAGFHPRVAPLTNAKPEPPDEYGVLYTDADLDVFLDCYLLNGGRKSKRYVGQVLGCNEKAVTMLEWKIPSGYPPFGRYKPGQRADRTGMEWNHRDVAMLKIARGTEAVARGVDTAFIAAVLGRSVADVEAHEAGLKQTKGRGFGILTPARKP